MTQRNPSNKPDRDDDRVSIPLDPEEALRALLAVDPHTEPEPSEEDGDSDAGQDP